jgi:hypothetical protein
MTDCAGRQDEKRALQRHLHRTALLMIDVAVIVTDSLLLRMFC